MADDNSKNVANNQPASEQSAASSQPVNQQGNQSGNQQSNQQGNNQPNPAQSSGSKAKKGISVQTILLIVFGVLLLAVAAFLVYFFIIRVNWNENLDLNISMENTTIKFPDDNYNTRVDLNTEVKVKNLSDRKFSGNYELVIRDSNDEIDDYKEVKESSLIIDGNSTETIDISKPVGYIPHDRDSDADGDEILVLRVLDKKMNVIKTESLDIEFDVVNVEEDIQVSAKVNGDIKGIPSSGELKYTITIENNTEIELEDLKYSVYLVESGQTIGGEGITLYQDASVDPKSTEEISESYVFSFRPLSMGYSEKITAKLRVVVEYGFEDKSLEVFSNPFRLETEASPY
jgi:hypothetical protein